MPFYQSKHKTLTVHLPRLRSPTPLAEAAEWISAFMDVNCADLFNAEVFPMDTRLNINRSDKSISKWVVAMKRMFLSLLLYRLLYCYIFHSLLVLLLTTKLAFTGNNTWKIQFSFQSSRDWLQSHFITNDVSLHHVSSALFQSWKLICGIWFDRLCLCCCALMCLQE